MHFLLIDAAAREVLLGIFLHALLGVPESYTVRGFFMPAPEELARQNIDDMLKAAGWQVQDRKAINLGAARGVAVREFPLKTGEAVEVDSNRFWRR